MQHDLAEEALAAATELAARLSPSEDGSPLLMLSIVHAALNKDACWVAAALQQFPRAQPIYVAHAAQWLKFLAPSCVDSVDECMKDFPGAHQLHNILCARIDYCVIL